MKEETFLSLIMPLQRQMYALCLTILKDEADAADCLQEVSTRLWENRRRLAECENQAGYCITAVRRVAIDMMRQRLRESHEDPPLNYQDPESSPTPAKLAECRDDVDHLSRLMDQLPPRQREVVEMSGMAGMSNREIEEATGLSGENVRVMLSRGRKRLKELFFNLK